MTTDITEGDAIPASLSATSTNGQYSLDSPPTTREARERVAGTLAKWLTLILAGTIFGTFVFGWWVSVDGAHTLGGIVITPVTTLVGSAIGYYYGNRNRND